MNYRYKRPDNKNALSIINAAKKELDFTLSLSVNELSGATIIRNIYESFRMLGDSILVAKGIKSQDHLEPLKELMNLKVKTSRPIRLIDSLRVLRHNINYYGYSPKLAEVNDAISIAKSLFNPLFKTALDEIKI